jgi:hypothetical protein
MTQGLTTLPSPGTGEGFFMPSAGWFPAAVSGP